MEQLQVSVVIPVFNAEPFVEAAVRSALQFSCVREVLIVDDGGPDNSLAICQRLARMDPRIILLRHRDGENRGAAASRNLGMQRSTAPWIAFLDADDLYLPERFDAEPQVLSQHPDADGVYGAVGAYFHDATGMARFDRTFHDRVTTVRLKVPPEKVFEGLTGGLPGFGHFHLNALTIRRTALDAMDWWMRPTINLHEDTDFCIRLAWSAKLYPGSIDAPVALRGVHDLNRITLSERYSELKLVLYRELWLWALGADCPQPACKYFLYKYRLNQLAMAKGKLQALAQAWHGRSFFKRYDYRELLFRRLGVGGRTAARIHALGQRFNRA